MSTVANLRAARAAIQLQAKWTTGKMLDTSGRMCALGAVAKVLGLPVHIGIDNEKTYDKLNVSPEGRLLARAAARIRCNRRWDQHMPVAVIYALNDSQWGGGGRNGLPRKLSEKEQHERVMLMFDEAIKEGLADSVLLP